MSSCDLGKRVTFRSRKIHEFRDYRIANTRVLNNPLGYQTAKDPERTGFRGDLTIDL